MSQHRLSMLQSATNDLDTLLKEVLGDEASYFHCKSAAIGALIANMAMNGFFAENMLAQSDDLPWDIFHQKVSSFNYPRWAACRPRVKPHVHIEERVSRCVEKALRMPLEREFHQLIGTQIRDAKHT